MLPTPMLFFFFNPCLQFSFGGPKLSPLVSMLQSVIMITAGIEKKKGKY